MTEKERFRKAFSPLHASPDTLTEVIKMAEQKNSKRTLRRTMTLALAAALILALGCAAYTADLGGIQRRVQLWIHGDQTDAVLTVTSPGEYTLNYTNENGVEHEVRGGGVAFEDDGTERPLTEEELIESLNEPELEYRDDGTVFVYYYGQALDITDKFDEDGVCYVQLNGGDSTLYMTIKYHNGHATSTEKYVAPEEFNWAGTTEPYHASYCMEHNTFDRCGY